MSKQVVVYPSGFVGYDVGWPIVRTEEGFDAQVAFARFASSSTKEKLVISNPVVEALFEQWRTRSRKTTQADFVGDVCAAVANAFGTMSFYEWCHMQLSNPYFTAYHRQYLNETLRFLMGEARSIGYPTWSTLLTPTRAVHEDTKERFIYRDVLLRIGMDNTSMHSIVQRWISQPKGVDDMLVTAHLLFGDVH